MTSEEREREGWNGEALCAVLDDGTILYAGCGAHDHEGMPLAQYAGAMWAVAPEELPMVPSHHRRPPPPPSRVERVTLALAVLFTVSSIVMVLLSVASFGEFENISLLGAGALGQAAAAACLWLLRAFIRVDR